MPPKKELQGKDLKEVKDANGVYLVQALRNQSQKGGGFVEYIWPKPGAGDVPKLSYAEMIPGTNYWIGTGVYLDNIESFTSEMTSDIAEKVNAMMLNMMMVSGVIFFCDYCGVSYDFIWG